MCTYGDAALPLDCCAQLTNNTDVCSSPEVKPCQLISYSFRSQQFPGLGGLPEAPTPPPAATSSVIPYQNFQGGLVPQGAFGATGYVRYPAPPFFEYFTNITLLSFPQRPPPLGQGQNQGNNQAAGNQFGPTPPVTPGLAQLPRDYHSQPPPPPGYNVGWQYTYPNAPQVARSDLNTRMMAPNHSNLPMEALKERRTDVDFAYRYHGGAEVPLPPQDQTVPVLLCHTCSICGQMRSAGYHRHHPVIPGKPIMATPCRKCKRRGKHRRHSRAASHTRVRRRTAYESPRPPIYIHSDLSEQRGRRKHRDDIYSSWRTDHLRPPYIIREGASRANIGLRTIQRSPPHSYKSTTRVRESSLSPERTRYDGVWPPPDVVRSLPSRSDKIHPAQDEVWPPADVVRTHSYRKKSLSRLSPRIIELSSSPPPTRSRFAKVHYQAESEERRPRSPVRRSESRIRLQSHPRAYRTVIPERRVFVQSDDTSTNDAGSEPVSRRIPKPTDVVYETSYRRRSSMRDSQQRTKVEVGGPHVQFAPEESKDSSAARRHDPRPRERYVRSEEHYYAKKPPSPPIDHMERLHIRHSSLSPQGAYGDIRTDRARRISPSPPPRRFEEIRVRYISVSPPPRECTPQPSPSPPPRERSVRAAYRHVSREDLVTRTRSLTPPSHRKHVSLDDVTDSEDEEGRLVEIRSWKGIDENGKPATFVEERRVPRMIEQESVGGGEFRSLTERLRSKTWRDV